MVLDKAPVNIYKSGQDPVLKPDSEYPAWLWRLLEPQPTLEALKAKPTLSVHEVGRSTACCWMPLPSSEQPIFPFSPCVQLRRLVKLERRRIIKEHNARSKAS